MLGNPFGLKVGRIIFIDEKKAGIKYEGVDKKDARPYIYYKKNHFLNAMYVIPITDQFNKDGMKKNHQNLWIPIQISKPSFIKTDSMRRISLSKANKLIWKGDIKINETLPRQTLNEIKHKLKNF